MASNRLTWDQVRAPDFEGVLDGFIASSNLIGNAMKTAQGGLDRIKAGQTDNADNAVMSRLLEYQGSPDRLTADLGSGAFQNSVDMSKISAGMREHLSKAPADLLKFAGDKSVYDQEQQRIGDMKYLRDNNPLVNDYLKLLDENKREEAAALLEANPEFRDKANFGLLAGMRESAARRFSTNVNNDDRQFQFGTDVRDDTLKQNLAKIDGILDGIVLPGDNAGAVRYINTGNNRKDLETKFGVEAVNAYMDRALNGVGGAGGGSGGGAGGGGGTVNAAAIVGSTDDASAVREAASQLGINAEDLAAAMSYETGGKFDPGIVGGKNNNHMGLIQFGKDEQAKYGIKPGMSIKDQMPAVVQYLKDRGLRPGDGLDRIYRTINGGNREANVKLSDGNGTIEEHIAKIDKDHRGNARAFLGLASPRDTQVLAQTTTAFNTGFNPELLQAEDALKATQDTRGALEIAQELTSDKGPFKGEDASALADLIYNEASAANVSPSAVVWALKRHSVGSGKFDVDKWMDDRGGKLFQWLFTDSLKGSKNEEGFRQSINFVKNRDKLVASVRSLDEQRRTAAAVGTANAAVAASQKTIDDRNAMARLLGMGKVDNSPYEEQAAKARGMAVLAGQAAAASASANDTSIRDDETPVPDGLTNTATVNLAAVPKEVSRALAINRLSGEVKERQAAAFKRTTGYTPEEVINNPKLVDRGVEDAISPREALRNQAQMAIAGGAATIAAFTRDNGIDPRKFLQN